MEINANQCVCVIGAGLAGLATAKVLQADGFDVTVFEKVPRVGGVWLPSRTYPELRKSAPLRPRRSGASRKSTPLISKCTGAANPCWTQY